MTVDLSAWQPDEARADLEAILAAAAGGGDGPAIVIPTHFAVAAGDATIGSTFGPMSQQRMLALRLPAYGQPRARTTIPVPAGWDAYALDLLTVSPSAEGGAVQLVVQHRANGVGDALNAAQSVSAQTLTVGPQWVITRHVVVDEMPLAEDAMLLRASVQRSASSGNDTLPTEIAVVALIARPA